MGFLLPVYLWLLSLSGLLVILYTWRPRKPHVAVSALWLWSEISAPNEEVGKKLNFPRIRELFWPCLALISLIFALSQPYLIFSEHKAKDIIFILDISASMQTMEGGSSRFDLARQEIVRIAEKQPVGARFMLIGAGAEAVLFQPFIPDPESLQGRLSEISPSDTSGDLLTAISLAKNYSQPDRDGFIYVVSDFADKISFPYLEDNMIPVTVGTSTNNVGIIDFQVPREELGSNRFIISLLIKNYAKQSKLVPITYALNKQVVDSEVLQLEPGESKRVFHRGLEMVSATLQVDLDLEDDFPLDNKVYAFLTPPLKVPVLMVSTKNSLLDQALSLHPEIALQIITPQQAREVSLSDYQIMITYEELLPVVEGMPQIKIRPARDTKAGEREKSRAESVKINWDPTHHLVKDLHWEGVFLTEKNDLTPLAGGEKVLWSEEGIHMTAGERAGVKTVIIGFNPVGGNFPFSPSFPIFWHNVFKWLEGDNTEDLPFYKTGLNYLPFRRLEKNRESWEILSSTGEKIPIKGRNLKEFLVEFSKTGWYQLRGKNISRPIAVDFISEEESDISPKSWTESAQVSRSGSSTDQEKNGQKRVPINQPLIVLGLAAMLTEWYLRGSRYNNK